MVGAGRGRARVRPGAGRRGATGCGWWSGPASAGGALRTAAVGPGRQRLAELGRVADRRVPRPGGRRWRPGVEASTQPTSTPPGRAGVEVVLATGSRPAPVGRPRGRVVSGGRPASACLAEGPGLLPGRTGGGARPGRRSGRGGDGRVAGRRRSTGVAGHARTRWPEPSCPSPATWPTPTPGCSGRGCDRELRAVLSEVGTGRPTSRTCGRANVALSRAPRSSTAATGCPRSPSTCRGRARCGPGTAWRRGACSRPCSRVAAWPSTSPGWPHRRRGSPAAAGVEP